MFNIFKKKSKKLKNEKITFEIELTAGVLAYEIARSDGEISESELAILLNEIKKISIKTGKEPKKVLEIIKSSHTYTSDTILKGLQYVSSKISSECCIDIMSFLFLT